MLPPTPKGPDSFVLTYKILKCNHLRSPPPPHEVHAPPVINIVLLVVCVESLFIGSYIYHSDVIAGMQLCYKSSEIIQSTCTYYSPFIIHTIW